MSRKLKRIFIWLAVVLALLLGLGVGLGVIYEDAVKQRIVQEVNRGLNTEIRVEHISFSVIEKFPYAALRFENLMALDAIETTAPKDTLLYAGKLFLEFNLLDVFTRNYNVRKVEVADAVLRLKVDENGNDNFHFWKARSDTAQATVGFELAEVGFRNVDFSFRSVQAAFHLNTQIDYLDLSGNFQEAVFDLDAESRLLVQTLTSGGTAYLQDEATSLDVLTTIDTRKRRYEVAEGTVAFEELDFALSGFFQDGAKQALDLRLNGAQLDIPALLGYIPERFKAQLKGYDPRGTTTFVLHLAGDPGDPDTPMLVDAEFALANAGVEHLKSGMKLKDFSASGRYDNRGDHPDLLELDRFEFKLKDGFIRGDGSVRNFDRPLITFDVEGEARLEDLQEILEIRALESISGGVQLECRFKGIVANPDQLRVADLRKSEISGQLVFSDAAFRIRGHSQRYHGIDGSFFLKGNDAAIKGLTGRIHSSDIALDGLFANFVPFVLIEDEDLRIEASLSSAFIDLAELIGGQQTGNSEAPLAFALPKHIALNVNADIDRLVFKRFEARDIFGRVRIGSAGIVAEPLQFKTCKGSLDGALTVAPKGPNTFEVGAQADIRSIDVQQLFTAFSQFGQDFITAEHLRGTTDADVVFRADMSNALRIDEQSIYSMVDIAITDGELIGHRSLIEVADYIRQNALLSVVVKTDELKRRLAHVSFSKLENQIEIKDSKVHIPEMELETSAMNLGVAGWHAFDSRVDYRINFRLAEILTNNTHSEFGEIEDDGSGGSFFLRMHGPLDKLDIAYDKQAAKEKRREKFKQEKETLKELLKEEFNIFGKKKDKGKDAAQDAAPKDSTGQTLIVTPEGKDGSDDKDDFWDELEEDDDF